MRFIDGIFDRTVQGLNKAMDLQWKRNEVVNANIANAETPQYRALDLSFGKELENAFGASDAMVARTDSKHIDLVRNQSARYVSDYKGATRADGNNVDIDLQMTQLAQNSSDYANAAQLIRRQIGLLRMAIRDGK